MSDYIEEMMKTAEVEPKYYYDVVLQDTIKPEEEYPLTYCSTAEVISFCRSKKDYSYCKVYKVLKVYPDFTSSKQLEIIKLILDIKLFDFGIDMCYKQKAKNQSFEQALAELVIELIEARELDEKKVKEILKR